jgi:5-formyltetrahydrofolate cyclo-ligase
MDKASLRALMRSVGPVPPEANRAIVDGLFAWLSPRLPGTISSFLAMTGEVDLSSLARRLPGWRWVLPRVEEDKTMTFRDAAVPLEIHRFGMQQPIATGPVIPIREIDVFLVPGLAFDPRGGRLGNGGGHYDRVLSRARTDAATIGICPRSHMVDRVPVEEHDRDVGYLATESGVVGTGPG